MGVLVSYFDHGARGLVLVTESNGCVISEGVVEDTLGAVRWCLDRSESCALAGEAALSSHYEQIAENLIDQSGGLELWDF